MSEQGYSSSRFERIVAIADEAIVSIDNRHVICLFNDGAERIFEYSRKEIIGHKLGVLLPERFRGVHGSHVDSFEHEGIDARKMNERGKIRGLRKNGEEFPAIASILKTGTPDTRNFTVIMRDISIIEELRENLQQRIALLEVSNQDMVLEKAQLSRTEDLLDKLLKQSHSY